MTSAYIEWIIVRSLVRKSCGKIYVHANFGLLKNFAIIKYIPEIFLAVNRHKAKGDPDR